MSLARAPERIALLREKGQAVAAYLRGNPKCFQEQAALAAGLTPKTYYEWLKGADEACVAFQMEVLPAIYERASDAEEKAELDIASSEGGSSAWANWWKWKLSQRYRKVFGDLAQKHEVEVSGPDGGPIRTQSIADMSVEQLTQLAALKDEEDA